MTDTVTPPTPPTDGEATAVNHVSFQAYAFRSEHDAVGSTYYHNGQLYVDDLHPAIQQPMAVRSATTFLTGQVVAARLAEHAPFTVEELAGEFGGGMPLEPNDPRKELLLMAAASMLDTVWEAMPAWAARLPDWLDEDLRSVVGTADTPFPEIDATIDGHAFRRIRLLYRARGGMFTLLAGIMLDYGSDHRWTFLLENLQAHPMAQEATAFLRRLLKFRNDRTDAHAEAALESIVNSVNADIHGLADAVNKQATPDAIGETTVTDLEGVADDED